MHQDGKDTLRDEYEFSGGVRGKHHEAYNKGTNKGHAVPTGPKGKKRHADPVANVRLVVNVATG